jgi:hypothetical protein
MKCASANERRRTRAWKSTCGGARTDAVVAPRDDPHLWRCGCGRQTAGAPTDDPNLWRCGCGRQTAGAPTDDPNLWRDWPQKMQRLRCGCGRQTAGAPRDDPNLWRDWPQDWTPISGEIGHKTGEIGHKSRCGSAQPCHVAANTAHCCPFGRLGYCWNGMNSVRRRRWRDAHGSV